MTVSDSSHGLPGGQPEAQAEYRPNTLVARWSTTAPDREPLRRGGRAGWVMLGVFAIAELTFLTTSVLVLVPYAGSGGDGLPAEALLPALVVPTAVAAAVAIGLTMLISRKVPGVRWARELGVHWSLRDMGVGLGIGAVGLVLTIPASALWAAWVGEDQANSAVGEIFDGQQLSPLLAVAVFASVWLLAPLCEEVLFRGVLWRVFEHWRWNRWAIFAATTLVFSFAHLELLRTPLLVVISIPLGLARMFTGNMLGSVVAHQANNFLPAVGLLLLTLDVAPA